MGRVISHTVHAGVFSVNSKTNAPVSANSKAGAGKSPMPKGKVMKNMEPKSEKISDKLEKQKGY